MSDADQLNTSDTLREAMQAVDNTDQFEPLAQARTVIPTREQIAEKEAWERKLARPMLQAFIDLQISATGCVKLDDADIWKIDMLRTFTVQAIAKVAS